MYSFQTQRTIVRQYVTDTKKFKEKNHLRRPLTYRQGYVSGVVIPKTMWVASTEAAKQQRDSVL